MTYLDKDPVLEVRENRELLLEKYNGIDGLHEHMDKKMSELKEQGFIFVPIERILENNITAI